MAEQAPIVVDRWTEPASPFDLFARLPRRPYRFLLESQAGPSDLCRYSFIGHRPFLRLEGRGRSLALYDEQGQREAWQGDAFEAIDSLLSRYSLSGGGGVEQELPPFAGGAVGYLAYDLGRQIERVPGTSGDDLGLPELYLAFYDHVLAVDHRTGYAFALAVPLAGRQQQAEEAARSLARLVRESGRDRLASSGRDIDGTSQKSAEMRIGTKVWQGVSNLSQEGYRRAAEDVLEHIRRGDVYQINLAQRFSVACGQSGDAIYDRLRGLSPAPFAAFLDGGEFQIVSASPERFLRVDPVGRCIQTRPIKGTRPRGATPEADDRLRAELLSSAKDQAELAMIVDLERNDLGRVCEYGSVHVPEARRLEAHPTVYHTVATVEGRLRPGTRPSELLRATFPGGSITGAPKIRAMQIIENLEGVRRGVYCGAIGYFGFDGAVDLNVAIRTITLTGGRAIFHAGGGIVADSDPQAEYEESLHKAWALGRALGLPALEGIHS